MYHAITNTKTAHTGRRWYLYFCHSVGSTATSSLFLFFFRRPFSLFSKASSSACCLRFSSSRAALASASFISEAFRFISLHVASHSIEIWFSRTLLHWNSFLILLQGHLSFTFWLQLKGHSPGWHISLHLWPQGSSLGHWSLQQLRRFFSFTSAVVIFLHSTYRVVILQWHFILSIWTQGGHSPGWHGKTHGWGQPTGRDLEHPSSHWRHSGPALFLPMQDSVSVTLWHSFIHTWFWQSKVRPQTLLQE